MVFSPPPAREVATGGMDTPGCAGFSIEVHRTFSAISSDWRALEQHAISTPFQSYSWLSSWYDTIGREEQLEPLFVCIRDADDELIVEHHYPGATLTYQSWAAIHFSEEALLDESISGWAADPNGRGTPNLYRYAFGAGPHMSIDSEGTFSYRRTSGTSDLRFILETCQSTSFLR